MGKKIYLTDEQEAYLRQSLKDNVPLPVMADHIGCCLDALKKILMRYHLASFSGAKYIPSNSERLRTWTRPCSNCGCTKPRPRWQYRCNRCHALEEKFEEDIL